jgi:hypothetical protein
MEAIRSSGMWVDFYQTTRRHNPEDRTPHSRCCETLFADLLSLFGGLCFKAVVPKGGSTAPLGALEVGPSERIFRLFTVEVTLDQTLGNWYHFIKPINRIKNLLTVK